MSGGKRVNTVQIIVIDMQSTLMARAFERILQQDMHDCQPIVSESPHCGAMSAVQTTGVVDGGNRLYTVDADRTAAHM